MLQTGKVRAHTGEKSLWRPQVHHLQSQLTASRSGKQEFSFGPLVTACSGHKASNNSDAFKNDKSGSPSATESRKLLLFNLFYFPLFLLKILLLLKKEEKNKVSEDPPPLLTNTLAIKTPAALTGQTLVKNLLDCRRQKILQK